MHKFKNFFKQEPVLSIAALAAILTCFFVPPSGAYLAYIDFKVLACLFALMLTVAGFGSLDVFRFAASKLLRKAKNLRFVGAILIFICFFLAMFVTNDVALLTFVPFTLLILSMSGHTKSAALIVVLETVAANLGSALTPFGNPQNLYIYSCYNMDAGEFFGVTAPFTIVSAILLGISLLLIPKTPLENTKIEDASVTSVPKLILYAAMFVTALLGVFGAIHYALMAVIVAVVFAVSDRKLFAQVDWLLLVTFVCFFIFVGNLSAITPIADALSALTKGRELIVGALVSQVISNVPAAVLLSGFTENARALLLGVNAGGCGTIIASLASLISYKIFSRTLPDEKSRYMTVFTVINIVFFILITAISYIIL